MVSAIREAVELGSEAMATGGWRRCPSILPEGSKSSNSVQERVTGRTPEHWQQQPLVHCNVERLVSAALATVTSNAGSLRRRWGLRLAKMFDRRRLRASTGC